MKAIKLLSVMVVVFGLGVCMALADQSCCVKAKVKGKDCTHECCVAARKDKKTCEKCQKEASCCDRAIATSKDCAHPCCVAAAKEKKICEKCNAPKKEAK